MRRPALFWGSTIGALGLIDFWCAKNAVVGDSLSECTRALFRTEHPVGRIAFSATYATGAYVLWAHICRVIDNNLAEF